MLLNRIPLASLAVGVCLALSACGGRAEDREAAAGTSAATAPVAPAPETPEAESARPRVVVLGDSLTAGLGLLETQSFPALLQQKIDEEGYQFDVENAGVSGDTSAGGLRRLDWALQGDVRVVILELGANDGLRGLSVAEMKNNLTAIVQRCRERGATVILAGMEAPPNYGREYATAFRQAYRDIARTERVLLIPFLLDGVAGRPELNQRDGIHPNVPGARIVAENVWRVLRPVLDQMSAAS